MAIYYSIMDFNKKLPINKPINWIFGLAPFGSRLLLFYNPFILRRLTFEVFIFFNWYVFSFNRKFYQLVLINHPVFLINHS
jgi:hypothetical protein